MYTVQTNATTWHLQYFTKGFPNTKLNPTVPPVRYKGTQYTAAEILGFPNFPRPDLKAPVEYTSQGKSLCGTPLKQGPKGAMRVCWFTSTCQCKKASPRATRSPTAGQGHHTNHHWSYNQPRSLGQTIIYTHKYKYRYKAHTCHTLYTYHTHKSQPSPAQANPSRVPEASNPHTVGYLLQATTAVFSYITGIHLHRKVDSRIVNDHDEWTKAYKRVDMESAISSRLSSQQHLIMFVGCSELSCSCMDNVLLPTLKVPIGYGACLWCLH